MFWNKRKQTDFNAEIDSHIELEIERLKEQGMSEEEARAAARRVFGNVTRARERFYESSRWIWLDQFWQDVRYGLRMVRKYPGFMTVTIISLGLGIGANTTIFTFVNALLLRPPQVEASIELRELWLHNSNASGLESQEVLNYPDYVYFRDHNHIFSGLAAFDGDPHLLIWNKNGQGEIVLGGLVSPNYFSVLGVKAELGREFLAEDGEAGAPAVIVLSHAFWKERLGGDPGVVGRTFDISGNRFLAIGVAPAGFVGLFAGIQPDFWATLAMTPSITRQAGFLTDRHTSWLIPVGRLVSGISIQKTEAELRLLSNSLQQLYPDPDKGKVAELTAVSIVPAPARGYVEAFTAVLMAIAGLVLLIACANAANLQLAQATSRRREMGIRTALGCGRSRLIRQVLIESTMVAALGGLVGLLLAGWSASALLTLTPPGLPIKLDTPIDWRVILFALGVSLSTGIMFGLAPAFQSACVEVAGTLKEETSVGGHRKLRMRGSLVVAQVAVCMVLLICAGLCVRSLINARHINPGFDTGHVLIAQLDPQTQGYSEAKGRVFYRQLVQRVETLPGVISASWAAYLPLDQERTTNGISPEERPALPGHAPGVDTTSVAPAYFKTMGIPLLSGRDFDERDGENTPHVVIINQKLAQQFWPHSNPIGKRIVLENSKPAEKLEVIGVVPTGRYRTLGEADLPFFFTSLLQNYYGHSTLVVRAAGDPRAALSEVRRQIRLVDLDMAPVRMGTMKDHMALPLFPAHTTGLLLGIFGLLGLVLAVGGLYGVMAYAVSQRHHEVGVRMALGARRIDVLRLIVGDGMKLTLLGVGIGLAGAFAGTRILKSLLYGISATDPPTFLLVSLILVLVAIAASYIPARRATKVDPMVALRHE